MTKSHHFYTNVYVYSAESMCISTGRIYYFFNALNKEYI